MALAALLEEVVRRFPRYHKYALGADLRRQAYAVCCGVVQAGEGSERLQAADSHRCPAAIAALAATDAAVPCFGAGARLPENRVQMPGVPFALVARAPTSPSLRPFER